MVLPVSVCALFFFLMLRRPPRSTLTYTLFPYTTLFRSTFANWAEAVPDGFKFSVKASRFTTNRKVLAEGAGSIEKFLTQGLTRIGERLGPLHWQFMATKKFDRDDFAGFLDLLPDAQDGLPLRHASRSEERRVGTERVSTCRSRGPPYLYKK